MALRSKRSHAPKPISRSKAAAADYSDVYCEKCRSGESPGELLLCDKCDKGFHLFCLRPILVAVPKGSWFCPSCSKQKMPNSFPLVQTKIIDFFRIQRSTESIQKLNIQKKRKRSSSLVVSKKRGSCCHLVE
uniref:PHD finger family protein n=1 Tax=Populus alba TaxID=43335 RepID=A0A4U5P4K3_POPAL|nr:PHD finger family protein [Populus alba]